MAKKIHTHEISGPDVSERSYGIAPPAFRLPDTTHIGGVRVQVSDLVPIGRLLRAGNRPSRDQRRRYHDARPL